MKSWEPENFKTILNDKHLLVWDICVDWWDSTKLVTKQSMHCIYNSLPNVPGTSQRNMDVKDEQLKSASLISKLVNTPARPPPPIGYTPSPPTPPTRTSASNINLHKRPQEPSLRSFTTPPPPAPPVKSNQTEVTQLCFWVFHYYRIVRSHLMRRSETKWQAEIL